MYERAIFHVRQEIETTRKSSLILKQNCTNICIPAPLQLPFQALLCFSGGSFILETLHSGNWGSGKGKHTSCFPPQVIKDVIHAKDCDSNIATIRAFNTATTEAPRGTWLGKERSKSGKQTWDINCTLGFLKSLPLWKQRTTEKDTHTSIFCPREKKGKNITPPQLPHVSQIHGLPSPDGNSIPSPS